MPKFFFDMFDGSQDIADAVGTELPDATAARQEATRTICEVAAQELPANGPFGQIRILVRDTERKMLFQLQLDFKTAEAEELAGMSGDGSDAGN